MPDNPEREGLIAQGWNWTLSNAKAYVQTYGKLTVGQMYVTDDNTTRFYISLDGLRLSPYLGIGVRGTATIDWGDNTSDTITGSSLTSIIYTQHTYPAAGDYVIKVTGNIGFGDRTLLRVSSSGSASNYDIVYASALTKVELGSIGELQSGAFYNCYKLASISLPHSITSIGTNVFRAARSLTTLIIPDQVTQIKSGLCYRAFGIQIASLPYSITSIQNTAFQQCYSLLSAYIPPQVTSIGDNAFNADSAIREVIVPNSVTTIGQKAFLQNSVLQKVYLSSAIVNLNTQLFDECFALRTITLPSNLQTIGQQVFYMCYSLAFIEFPATLTTLGTQALYDADGLSYIRFRSTTPPTATSNTFYNLPEDCIIYIPAGTLAAYTSAENYPSSSTYTYIEE